MTRQRINILLDLAKEQNVKIVSVSDFNKFAILNYLDK